MARIKIELPQKSIANFRIPVRITDINYANHMGNDSLVGIIHEARMNFLQLYGFTEMDVMGTSLIMSELVVVFKNEAFYKDMLDVKIFIGELTRVSFEIFYSLSVTRNEKTLQIATAKTNMICFNYSKRKVDALPESFKLILLQ